MFILYCFCLFFILQLYPSATLDKFWTQEIYRWGMYVCVWARACAQYTVVTVFTSQLNLNQMYFCGIHDDIYFSIVNRHFITKINNRNMWVQCGYLLFKIWDNMIPFPKKKFFQSDHYRTWSGLRQKGCLTNVWYSLQHCCHVTK